MTDQTNSPRPTSRIRDQQNFVGGLGLLGFVLIGWIASDNLAIGTLNSLGPGMLPRVVLALIAAVGVALIAGSFVSDGPRIRIADFSALIAVIALILVAVVLGALAAVGGAREIFGMPAFAALFCILYAAVLVGLLAYNTRVSGWLDRSGLRGPLFVIGGLLAFALTVRDVGLLLAAPLLAVISGAASHETRFAELIVFAIGMTLLCVGVFKYALNLPIPILVIPGVIYI
jgi:hypothetical protein